MQKLTCLEHENQIYLTTELDGNLCNPDTTKPEETHIL